MRAPRYLLVPFALVIAVSSLRADGWMQLGRSSRHDGNVSVPGQSLDRVLANVTLDPFTDLEEATAGGELLAHYQAPLVDGDDVFIEIKGGTYAGFQSWSSETWTVRDLRWSGDTLAPRWTFTTDWTPVPPGSPNWEPLFHCALTSSFVYAPAAGGTVEKIDRDTGTGVRINPFGTINSSTFVSGPLTVDDQGNVFYNAIQLDPGNPWSQDVVGAWLVRIGADGSATKVPFSSIVMNAPAANAHCTSAFSTGFPFPPSADAVAPTVTCGSQRPGINVAPAVAADGTIYTISRAQFTDRWGYLVAVNPDLSPKWTASLRNRLSDGCNVTIPPNGTPGGCRAGATTGVDPSDNQPGSGRVLDDATSSPSVLPDGRILYGAFTRYNYDQGHLMLFTATGDYVGAYGWGWDQTPSVYRHDGTYSILVKENHYAIGSYCSDGTACPPNRSLTTPNDPEAYFITQIDPSLHVEWRFKSTNTKSCERESDGTLQCVSDEPAGFEWCVNAIAVDADGVVYANSEDGNVYAITQGGVARQNIFLRLALGAAYTPISIGPDGRIYAQNDGELFVIGNAARRRAVGR